MRHATESYVNHPTSIHPCSLALPLPFNTFPFLPQPPASHPPLVIYEAFRVHINPATLVRVKILLQQGG